MASSSPLFRDDTLFGVCQALGEDFGFNPNIPRAMLGTGLLFAPVTTLIVYAVAAIVVGIARWFFPDPIAPEAAAGESTRDRVSERIETQEELPLAA